MNSARNNQAGFTLVEIIVVAGITVFITGILVANFSRTKVDLNTTALVLTDAIREPQALALSGSAFGQSARCGYGIHFLANGYVIYAGPKVPPTDCSAPSTRLYGAGADVRSAVFSNNLLEIAPPLPPDIYFEPPDPTTYIGGALSTNTTIILRRKGANCTGQITKDCRKIYVTTSGLIESK